MSPSFDPFMPNPVKEPTKEWTWRDAEKAYKKYLDLVDEYKWPIEDIDGEDWVPLLNVGDTVIELRRLLNDERDYIKRLERAVANLHGNVER